MRRYKILVLNDRLEILNVTMAILRKMDFIALEALTLKTGWEVFIENPDVLAIFVDGSMSPQEGHSLAEGEPMSSEDFVRKVRAFGYPIQAKGYLIAASASSNQELIRAGCDQGCQTPDIPRLSLQFRKEVESQTVKPTSQ